MVRKVCVTVGHGARHGAKHGAKLKNEKILDFFKFFKKPTKMVPKKKKVSKQLT